MRDVDPHDNLRDRVGLRVYFETTKNACRQHKEAGV
jgi:hypothetical protein